VEIGLKKIIILNKKEGETPLEALESFRSKNKEYKDVKMTYAGRLDPMASGLLLILTGEETKNKDKYNKLDKEYEFEILFGFATDTYDVLGKVICVRQDLTQRKELEQEIKENLKYFEGKFIQTYPIYSSKTVRGKQLFEYARNGEAVELPSRDVNVKSLKFIKLRKINSKNLRNNVSKRISKVQGDFRQKEILKLWRKNLKFERGESLLKTYFICSFYVKCSSGTYIRSISNSLGEKIGIPALAFSIKRTKVGKYKLP